LSALNAASHSTTSHTSNERGEGSWNVTIALHLLLQQRWLCVGRRLMQFLLLGHMKREGRLWWTLQL
jgi:hypothetical protein